MMNKVLTCSVLLGCSLLVGCSNDYLPWVKPSPKKQAQEMAATTQGLGQNPTLDVAQSSGAQTVYFDLNQSLLHAEDKQKLDVLAQALMTHADTRARVEGNTDERGSREYNVALGWRRARSVARYLQQHGVSQQQLALLSYGPEHPAVLGHSERAWSKNRRVELHYVDE